jgi:hypothetical protein
MRRVFAPFLAFLLAGNAFANPLALVLANQDTAPNVADPAASNEHEAIGEADTAGTVGVADLSDLGRRLTAIASSYEAIRDPAHLDSHVKRLVQYAAPQGLILDPANRAQTLDHVYRALALIDDTQALRYREGEECARAHRLALLRSPDGLFSNPKTGELSPWLKAELKRSKANEAPVGLIAASAREWTALGYLQTLAEVRSLSLRLADGEFLGPPRAASFCRRAKLYGDLASAQGSLKWDDPDLLAQAQSVVEVRLGKEKGTGTALLLAGKPVVLVSGRFTENAYEPPDLYAKSGQRLPASYVRRGPALSILSIQPSPDVVSLIVPEEAEQGDLVAYAVGNPVQGGPWSVTRGLARPDGGLIRTDAAIDGAQAGGPLFDARGRLAGIIAGEGAAYGLASISGWLVDANADLPELSAARELGTGALLTASSANPQEQSGLIESAMVCKDVRGCTLPSEPSGGGSGYSYSAPYTGPNLWSILGKMFSSSPKAAPPVVEYRRNDPPPVVVEAPKPPPEPPKPECSFAAVDAPKTVGTAPVELRVQFSCKYPDGAKPVDLSGHDVVFSVGWKGGKVITRTVKTDARGIASVPLVVQSVESAAEKAHDALDKYDHEQNTPAPPPVAPAPFIGVSRGGGLINTASSGGQPPDSVGISSSVPDASQVLTGAAIVLVHTQATETALVEAAAVIKLGAAASTVVFLGAGTVSFYVGWKIGKFALAVDKEMNESLDKYNEAIDTNKPARSSANSNAPFDALDKAAAEPREDGGDTPPECENWQEKVRRLRKGARSLNKRLEEHLEKVNDNPDSRSRNHWMVEIRAFKENIDENESEARRLEELCGDKNEIPKE